MSAQGEAVPSHYRRVLRFVRRRTSSVADAEDITQEVFANAVAHLEKPGTEAPTLSWLYTVARRRIADEARRRGRSQAVPLELVADPAAHDDGYGRAVAEALEAGLATMPEGQRRVVVRRLLQGRSFAEIGRELRTSEDACRMRCMRGLQHLRDEFEKEGLEP
jgi:RNA polymerase sigma factor (sigma-70 family)